MAQNTNRNATQNERWVVLEITPRLNAEPDQVVLVAGPSTDLFEVREAAKVDPALDERVGLRSVKYGASAPTYRALGVVRYESLHEWWDVFEALEQRCREADRWPLTPAESVAMAEDEPDRWVNELRLAGESMGFYVVEHDTGAGYTVRYLVERAV